MHPQPHPLLVLGAWSDGTPSEERMAGLPVSSSCCSSSRWGSCSSCPPPSGWKRLNIWKEQIALAYGVEGIVERQKQEYAPTYRRSMTQGVVLCVLMMRVPVWARPCWKHQASGTAAVGLLLAIVAGAVQLFIRARMTQERFDSCCKQENTPSAKSGRTAASIWFARPTVAL